MDDSTKSIIQEQFKLLPKIIQDTILNSNWQEKIRRIVKNNNLHVDQGAAIENLVLITMLGIETPETFVENAKEYAEVTEEQAYTISNEVEREVFSDIRRKLIQITETANTVDDIERSTEELNKVADDIEKETRTSLKEKIPVDSFKKPEIVEAPKLNKLPDVPKAPEINIVKNITEQQDKKEVVAPNIDLQKAITDNVMSVKTAESVNDASSENVVAPAAKQKEATAPKPIFTPIPKIITPPAPTPQASIKIDPYREPVE